MFTKYASAAIVSTGLLVACAGSPIQPSAASASPSTNVVTGGIAPSATDDPTATVTLDVRDTTRCSGGEVADSHGNLIGLHIVITGPTNATFDTDSAHAANLTLGYGRYTYVSTAARGDWALYGATSGSFDVPAQTFVQIDQQRNCGTPVEPPPPTPVPPVPPVPVPPTPVPPTPVPPVPPPTCQQTNPPRYDAPRWDSVDPARPIEASIKVYNQGTWAFSLYARIDGGAPIHKTTSTAMVACGASQVLRLSYSWTGHPAQEWWLELDGPTGHYASPIYTRP